MITILFYDFEVLSHDWLVVFMDTATKQTTIIKNSPGLLKLFYENHKKDIFAGYNSNHYDQYIFKGILLGHDPKIINDFIIHKKEYGWKFCNDFYKIKLNNYDVKTRHDAGLKTLEGYMGENISESGIDFDIDRKLTDDELEELSAYCCTDVEQTMKVFLHRSDDFDVHLSLIKAFKLPLNYIGKTKAQLAAKALKAEKWLRTDEYDLLCTHNFELNKYRYVLDWFRDKQKANFTEPLFTMIAGVDHVFGWGGLHGALRQYHSKSHILALDVISYYPALMLNYGLLSRNVADPDLYRDIYNKRLKLKADGNPLHAAYKLVLNGVFGACKDKFNELYDPRQFYMITMYGQLFLLELIECLEPYCQLIQTNTDGLLLKWHDSDDLAKIIDICDEWRLRTGFELEFAEYREVWQKDVNNYVLLAANEFGSDKFIGAYVKPNGPLDNDLSIVNEAVRNWFIKGITPEDTINDCDELIKFQKVVKIKDLDSSAAIVATGRLDILKERTLRVFASNDCNDGRLVKLVNGVKEEKIPNVPERCFIDNSNVIGKQAPDKLDRQYYIDLANERIESFEGFTQKRD